MIEAFGGAAWWPLTSQVALLRAQPGQVLALRNRTGRGRVHRFDHLSDAVAAQAPYEFGRRVVTFLVATVDGETLMLNSGAPNSGLLHLSSDAAQLRCECVTASWTPANRGQRASAGFSHYRPRVTQGAIARGAGQGEDRLSLQVSDQGRWCFDRLAPYASFAPRAYEEPEAYRVRRIAARLPLDLIRRYLAGAGIPVDDPHYLTGPVLTVGSPPPAPMAPAWSTIAELRAIAGYPPDGIPGDLRAQPTPLA